MKTTVETLTPAPYNPRKGWKRGQAEAFARSVKEFGDLGGIIRNRQTGNLVGGHKRIDLLRQGKAVITDLKPATDPTGTVMLGQIIAENGTRFAFREVDWKPAKEKRANLAANAWSAEWDTAALDTMIRELTPDQRLDAGFSDADLKALGIDLTPELPPNAEPQMDLAEELNKHWKVKTGDVWEIGQHRLVCGDSTDEQTVKILMSGGVAAMVHTDPPYNVDYGASKKKKISAIAGDKQSPEQWESFCKNLYEVFKKYNAGDVYMWGASSPEGMRMRLWLVEAGCHWSATLVWKKQQLILTPANYQRMYEPCFYGWFDKSSFVADRKQTEVWEIDRPHDSKLHPTMKPLELCARAIQNSSNEGQIVLDCFLGSGSTMVAAEGLKRRCFGVEISPAYCAVVLQRMKDAFKIVGKRSR